MKRFFMLICAGVALAGLTACGEKPQTLGAKKTDVAPYQSAQSQFTSPGWQSGDKTSWEQGLKARMQRTQNEYSKTNLSH
ncbi:MAG: hypothetical protein M3R45_00135 [Pseudomonadota bacterium]|nr:hypothetical protein [Pseudomonadota bacterium]